MEFGYHNASPATSIRLPERQVEELRPELEKVRRRFWAKVSVKSLTECWPWKAAYTKGAAADGSAYGSFRFEGRSVGAHRVAYILTYGPIHDGLDILHSCDVKACCNPTHLSVGVHRNNMADASQRGRLAVPHPKGRSKLTSEQVAELIAFVKSYGRGGHNAAAVKYGVSQAYVTMIVRGKRRKYDAPIAVEKAS